MSNINLTLLQVNTQFRITRPTLLRGSGFKDIMHVETFLPLGAGVDHVELAHLQFPRRLEVVAEWAVASLCAGKIKTQRTSTTASTG